MAPITLHFLQTSRAIRTAWLLEELKLAYTVERYDREPNGNTPSKFRDSIPVGRAPAIQDGDLMLVESSAIAE
jgi:glutathione S-transferase